jgi:hypothetical protein
VAPHGEAGGEAGAGGGFADAALAGRYNDNSSHEEILYFSLLSRLFKLVAGQ